MMVPVGRLVVLRDLPKEKLVKTVAIITWPALSAPLLGPVLGGYIATHFSWQWIFYMNIPLGIIAIIASLYLLKNIKGNVGKFDIKGFLLTGIGFALFMAGIEFLASTSDKLIRPRAMSTPFTTSTRLKPKVFMIHVVAGFIAKFPANSHSNSEPASTGE